MPLSLVGCVKNTLTRQEKLRHLFRLFDASCDGFIDAEELGRLLSRMNVELSKPEVVALLQKMDG